MASTDNSQNNGFFGFLFRKPKDQAASASFVPPTQDDGAQVVNSYAGQYNQYLLDIDPSSIKSEAELILKYRELAMSSEIDRAVDEIVNEMVVYDEFKQPITIDFSEDFAKQFSEKTKKLIIDEFNGILGMLNFNQTSNDFVRKWYVDGKIAFHKIIDKKNLSKGIVELRYIDSSKIKRVVELVKDKDQATGVETIKEQKEYFIYSEKGSSSNDKTGVKITADAIAYATSGIIDYVDGKQLSYLHKAIRPMNQLKMMEDAQVIYKIVRAPERRIFYIDTSGMNRSRAEQYLRDTMARYKNKQVYDAKTGEIKDDKKHLSLLEDFWLPRSNGNKGTEVTTLPGGQGFGNMDDIMYFQQKLYESLNIPMSRLQQSQPFNLGRSNEISRDEIKFSKFIEKLRKRFNMLFLDLLKTQLLLKNITTIEDWEVIKDNIFFNYLEDNFYAELKESDMFQARIANVQMADQFVGKYFSSRYVMRQLLRLTDDEIRTMQEEIKEAGDVQPMMQPMPGMADPEGKPLPAPEPNPAGGPSTGGADNDQTDKM